MFKRSRRQKFGVALTALALTAGTLAACSKSGGNAQAAKSDTIAIGTMLGPTSLDPSGGISGTDYAWLDFLYSKLIKFNSQTDALEPGLASSWNWVGTDKTELDLTLQHGVTFQDGTPFDADAVVYNLKRFFSKGDIANDLQYMTTAEAIGTDKVAIHLSQPNAQLIFGLADRAGMMISPTADKKEGKNYPAHPVGTGPYQFVSEVPNVSYSFTSYKGYYLDKQSPRVKNIKVQTFQTATAMATAEQTGNIQVATNVPSTVLKPLQADKNATVSIAPGETPLIVWFDGKLKPLDNPKMRLAFNLALDRTAIMKAATNGLGTVVTELEPQGTLGYVKSMDPLWPVNGDPAKARELVKEAGYPNGVSFTCYNYPGIGYDVTDPIIESEEAAVGIHVKVLNGSASISGDFFKGKSGPCMMSGYTAVPNPVEASESMLWSKSFYDAQAADFGVDQYFDQVNNTYDLSQINGIYQNIWAVEKVNPGAAPLYSAPVINVYDKNIKGWIESPIAQDNWAGMTYAGS